MAKPSNLVIDWTHVMEVSINDIDRMGNAHLFSKDLGTVVYIESATVGKSYKLTVAGEEVSYTAVEDDTQEKIATSLIDKINSCQGLMPLVEAQGPPTGTEKSLRRYTWFGAKDVNQFEIRSVLPFTFFKASSAEMDVRLYQNEFEPLRLGGRSVILQQVANRTLRYKNSMDLSWMQINLAAHFAAMNLVPAAGQGTIASKTFEGEGISFTMPKNNPKAGEVRLTTNYGTEFLTLTRGKKCRLLPTRRRRLY